MGDLPHNAITLHSYAELEKFGQAFAAGHLGFVMVCGAPGVGKSQTIRRVLDDEVCWISGNASPFGIYCAAYEHLDSPVVLDDVDGLYRDRTGVRLLKSLCQSDTTKTLSWESAARDLTRRQIPRQFATRSRVAILANEWQTLSADVAALQDRGHLLLFQPSATEVHRQAAAWFWDQSVFDFIGQQLHLLPHHSLRTYVLAWELKRASLDWRQAVLARCGLNGTALIVARLKADPSFTSEEARATAFVVSRRGPCDLFQPRPEVRENSIDASHSVDGVAADGSFARRLRPASPPVRATRKRLDNWTWLLAEEL